MPLARQFQRPLTLQQMLGIEPEVGQQPSGIAFNDYLSSLTDADGMNERNREAGVIANMDARTNASMAQDLAEAKAVESARNLGFEGSYPLQEQAQWGADQKLRQLLLPKQMELEAETKRLQNTQAFTAGQSQLNRDAAASNVRTSQAGQNARAAAARAHAMEMAKQTGRIKGQSWLSSLFGGGDDSTGEMAAMAETPIGTRKTLPNGIEVEWDGNGWAGVE